MAFATRCTEGTLVFGDPFQGAGVVRVIKKKNRFCRAEAEEESL
jgi:hypothetical protein